MAAVSHVLRHAVQPDPELRGPIKACGKNSTRQPPTEKSLSRLRARLAGVLGSRPPLPRPITQHRGTATTSWMGLVRRTKDTDTSRPKWAKEGAPMGIDEAIEPGGHIPTQDPKDDITFEELVQLDSEHPTNANHGSVRELHGQEVAPGVEFVSHHLEQGFGILFESREAAEQWFGGGFLSGPVGQPLEVEARRVGEASSTPGHDGELGQPSGIRARTAGIAHTSRSCLGFG